MSGSPLASVSSSPLLQSQAGVSGVKPARADPLLMAIDWLGHMEADEAAAALANRKKAEAAGEKNIGSRRKASRSASIAGPALAAAQIVAAAQAKADKLKQMQKKQVAAMFTKPPKRTGQEGVRTNAPCGRELAHRHSVIVPTVSLHLLWHKSLCGSQATLADGRRTLDASGGYCGALLEASCSPHPCGTHVVEVLIMQPGGPGCALGMAAKNAELTDAPGMCAFSVGLRRDGKLYRDGAHVPVCSPHATHACACECVWHAHAHAPPCVRLAAR